MKKQEFLNKLKKELRGLPKKEIEEQLNFYSEMISDRMEEGLTEEEAVEAIGGEAASSKKISGEFYYKNSNGEVSKRNLSGWELAVIIGGAPIWLSLAIAALAVIFSLWISLWAVIVSFWAVFVSFALTAPAAVLLGIVLTFKGFMLTSLILFSGALVLSGLAIFAYFGCRYLTKYSILLTKKLCKSIVVINKEEVVK